MAAASTHNSAASTTSITNSSNYAREHRIKYPTLTPDFVVGPADLTAFRAFAEDRGFNYISDLEAQIEELDKVAEGEEYNQLAKPLSHLTDEIEKIEEKHWQDGEDLIAWRLTFAILEKHSGSQWPKRTM